MKRWVELWAKHPVLAVEEMRLWRYSARASNSIDPRRWLAMRLEERIDAQP